LLGWLVIVLHRHAEAMHELTPEEATELGALQRAVAISLQTKLGCAKEYSVCYGEAPRFSHLHVHLIPRAYDLDESLIGGGIFGCLRSPEEAVDEAIVSDFCVEMRGLVATGMELLP
jgi:diadenosine tetraphosphate (Ap4A) HIT family hydrolase